MTPPYGLLPDTTLAAHLHLSPSMVARRRQRAGIPAWRYHTTSRRYLTLLAAHPHGLTTPILQRRLRVTRQGAQQMLSHLTRDGFATGVQLPRGRFSVIPPIRWTLTPQGHAFLDTLQRWDAVCVSMHS